MFPYIHTHSLFIQFDHKQQMDARLLLNDLSTRTRKLLHNTYSYNFPNGHNFHTKFGSFLCLHYRSTIPNISQTVSCLLFCYIVCISKLIAQVHKHIAVDSISQTILCNLNGIFFPFAAISTFCMNGRVKPQQSFPVRIDRIYDLIYMHIISNISSE